MESTKIIGGALVLAGLGLAGFFGYKLYKQQSSSTDQSASSMSGLGAFVDGNIVDYNAVKTAQYWARQRELYLEQNRLRALGL